MITREADYGMRVVLALSKGWRKNGVCKPVSEIAQEMEIPYRFLRKIAGRMASRGLVESRKGKCGGLRLVRAPSSVSVLDVLLVMAPDSADVSACVKNPDRCQRSSGCSINKAFQEIQRDVAIRLKKATFDRLAAREQAGSRAACKGCRPGGKKRY